jgi:hypothetical protein
MGFFNRKVKGPKTILSSAIANKLGTYFVVDESTIESNLLTDTKIVLNDILLKDQLSKIQAFDSDGRSSMVHITGQVKQVIFSWKWNVTSSSASTTTDSSSWVQDATLTIRGLDFKAKLFWLDSNNVHEDSAQEKHKSKKGSEKKDEGSLKLYMKKQVAMIIDSLKLDIQDYKFTLKLQPTDNSNDQLSIMVGGEAVEVISVGRRYQTDNPSEYSEHHEFKKGKGAKDSISIAAGGGSVEMIHQVTAATLPLEQWFMMKSFSVHVYKTSEPSSVLPLLGNFSYNAKVVRLYGERFLTGMATGLKVKGDSPKDSQLAFYVSDLQLQTLKVLANFVLAPPSDHEIEETGIEVEATILGSVDTTSSITDVTDEMISYFEFPFNSVSLNLTNSKLEISSLVMNYRADGTLAEIQALRMDVEQDKDDSEKHMCLAFKGIKASLRPPMSLEMQTIETLRVPGTVEFTNPVHDTSISYTEDKLFIKLSTVYATRLNGNAQSDEEVEAKISKRIWKVLGKPLSIKALVAGGEKAPKIEKKEIEMNWKSSLSFPIILSIQDLYMRNAHNALTIFNSLELNVAPGVLVSVFMKKVQNEMMELNEVAVSAVMPPDVDDEIRSVHFTATSTSLTAGHSPDEWETRFENNSQQKRSKSTNYKLPYVYIEPMNLRVAFRGVKGVLATNNSEMITKPFMGNNNTTKRDLIKHYSKYIIAKFPGFVKNAEVLGINVVDSATSSYGGWILKATPMGALGGLAAVAGVDAVKGAIAAGRRSRPSAEQQLVSDNWKATDLVRGVFHAAKEAAEEGAAIRGTDKKKNDVVDWAVGATANTSKYAKENKSRLASAGAGGAAMIAGTVMLGGIAVPLAAGVVASAVTKKVIEKADSSLSL